MAQDDEAPRPGSAAAGRAPAARRSGARALARLAGWTIGLAAGAMAALLLVVAVALAVAYPNLPQIDALTDYRPKLPLRVFSADGVQLGEYGEERRNYTPIG